MMNLFAGLIVKFTENLLWIPLKSNSELLNLLYHAYTSLVKQLFYYQFIFIQTRRATRARIRKETVHVSKIRARCPG